MILLGQQQVWKEAISQHDYVEARFFCGLPARGRTVLGNVAQAMLFQELPKIVDHSLLYDSIKQKELAEHVYLAEDQEFIRESLPEQGLVAFVADGSVLPRRSGVSDLPLTRGVIPFMSPPSLMVSFKTPNHGQIKGMGIPQGVTLIVGGGFHGKSTLLHALERGVYNHLPADGREWVITIKDAVKIRAEAEEGLKRWISVRLSTIFRADIPAFSTENASGSTSQGRQYY